MTLEDLKEMIENLIDNGVDEDTEVRLMMQPNWPFEYSVIGYTTNKMMHSEEEEGDLDDESPEIVYLCEGSQLGYGTRNAWENVEFF